jgi:hypothetical protein
MPGGKKEEEQQQQAETVKPELEPGAEAAVPEKEAKATVKERCLEFFIFRVVLLKERGRAKLEGKGFGGNVMLRIRFRYPVPF